MESPRAARLEERKRQFMAPFDPSDQRQRRDAFAVELRRQKRNEGTHKRRLLAGQRFAQGSEEAQTLELRDFSDALTQAFPQLRSPLSGAPAQALKELLSHPNLSHELYRDGLTALRKLLSRDICPPTEVVVDFGFVPIVLRFMNMHDFPAEIVLEATWAMCNIVSGSKKATEEAIRAGCIQAFLSVLDPAYPDILEVAIWGLGNLAGDCVMFRDLLINSRVHEIIAALIRQSQGLELKVAKVTAWTLASLVRGKPTPPLNVCESIVKATEVIIKTADLETVKDCLWALSHISDADNEYTQLIINAGLGKVAMSYLPSATLEIVLPALRIVGNIASGDDLMTQHVLDQSLLDKLAPLLQSNSPPIRKEVMWTLSNISAGTGDQCQAFLSHPIARDAVRTIGDGDLGVRREASWCFSNVVKKGRTSHKLLLLDLDILPFLKLLLNDSVEIVPNGLILVDGLLEAGKEQSQLQNIPANLAALKMEESGCLLVLEQLTHHSNAVLASESLRILNLYFTPEDNFVGYQDAPAPRFAF